MKTVAAILDVCLLVFASYSMGDHGRWSSGDLFGFLLILALVAVNLLAIFLPSAPRGWLALYWRRKLLEEQRKIDALESTGR